MGTTLPAAAPAGGRWRLTRGGRLALAGRAALRRASLAVLPLTLAMLALGRRAPGLACRLAALSSGLTALPRRLASAFGDRDLCPVLQPVGAVGDDLVARVEPLQHRDVLAVIRTERHRVRNDRIVG